MSRVRNRSRNSAFTLIELLLVLVILAVLASIVVVNFSGVTKSSNEGKAKTDISNLETALEMYHNNVNDYPATLDGLVNNNGAQNWAGPYIKKGLPIDPWGHAYIYEYPGQHNTNGFDLSSLGDAKGTSGPLDNWTPPTAGQH
jgi:general secretion pathway protein G